MEKVENHYREREIKANDFRELSEIDRKMLVQRFIDQVIYDSKKFKAAVKVLEEWENKSNNQNKN